MPPKNKFTRTQIIQAGLEVVRKQGLSGLTARSLADQLGSSSKVIFGQFENMEELTQAVVRAAEMVLVQYIQSALQQVKPFRAVGMAYVQFACQEPQLFQILYMNPHQHPMHSFADFLPQKDYSYQEVLASITEEFGLSLQEAEQLYQHLFIYSHGLASMSAAGSYLFQQEEIIDRMTQICLALIKEMKGKQ